MLSPEGSQLKVLGHTLPPMRATAGEITSL